eukprot:scaffold35735_cov37-Attheya_sp.AAC.1
MHSNALASQLYPNTPRLGRCRCASSLNKGYEEQDGGKRMLRFLALLYSPDLPDRLGHPYCVSAPGTARSVYCGWSMSIMCSLCTGMAAAATHVGIRPRPRLEGRGWCECPWNGTARTV